MPCYVAIDFETAGHEPWSACAVGLTRIENGRIGSSFYTLLRPPSSRVLFTEIHGLTWAKLKNAPTFVEAWGEIVSFCQGASGCVAHNASFDRRVLEGSLSHWELTSVRLPFLCTLKGARKALTNLPSRSLDALCRYFSLRLDHHHAGSDALACAEIFLRLRAMGVSEQAMRLR